MILYRFCSKFKYALDAVVFGRLYCATRAQLNDPSEGDFGIEAADGWPEGETDRCVGIREQMEHLRICSFTKNHNLSMWAYYGKGFKGVALELDLPDEEVCIVDYSNLKTGIPRPFTEEEHWRNAAMAALTGKGEVWGHEDEYRIIRHESELADGIYYELPTPPLRVIFGGRIERLNRDLLAHACRERGIRIMTAVYSRNELRFAL